MTISNFVIATRIHLGKAASPPSSESLEEIMQQLFQVAKSMMVSSQQQTTATTSPLLLPPNLRLQQVVIAVDATPKFTNYDLVQAVQEACDEIVRRETTMEPVESSRTTAGATIGTFDGIAQQQQDGETIAPSPPTSILHVLPVTPWGMFVPALNALLVHAMSLSSSSSSSTKLTNSVDYILFVSAESCTSLSSIETQLVSTLWQHMNPETTLVCGAVLPGHDYEPKTEKVEKEEHSYNYNDDNVATFQMKCVKRELTGRTCPWNTMALWNLKKLCLTGFLLVSDGIVDPEAYGIEEVVVIATLQRLLGCEQAMAKLVPIHDIQWEQEFDHDPQRKQWHEQKMASKATRAQRQLNLLGQHGWVHHYY